VLFSYCYLCLLTNADFLFVVTESKKALSVLLLTSGGGLSFFSKSDKVIYDNILDNIVKMTIYYSIVLLQIILYTS
jgi:hypothetical protein